MDNLRTLIVIKVIVTVINGYAFAVDDDGAAAV